MQDGVTRYLLPCDATPASAEELGISTKALADALGPLPAEEVVVIIDCCHSDAHTGVFWKDLAGLQQGHKSRYVIAAAKPFQQAIDLDTGSPLTQGLCDALDGKGNVRTSAEGLVSASAAYEYAEERVRQEASRNRLIQTPTQCGYGSTIYLTRPPVSSPRPNGNNHRGQNGVLEMLSTQMRDWFDALGYSFERDNGLGDGYLEWIINVPARRGFDRILVRGVGGQARVTDFEELRRSKERQRANEGWLVAVRLVDQAAREEAKKTEDKDRVFCYTFDELVEEQVDLSRYFDWLKQQVAEQEIEKYYVPLACTKPEFHPESGERMAEARYDERHRWMEGYLDVWLDHPGREHVSILGEFGTGKTWFTLRYASVALQRYLDAKKRGVARPRIPLVIPLRDYAKAVTVSSRFPSSFFVDTKSRCPDTVPSSSSIVWAGCC